MDVSEELAATWAALNVKDRSVRMWTRERAPGLLTNLSTGAWWAWLILVPKEVVLDENEPWVYAMNKARPEGYVPDAIRLRGGWKVIFT